MTTQELKQQIDKVLGNNIRCLLPSYWWKRLFNQVADRIDDKQDALISGRNIKTINGKNILGEGNTDVDIIVGSIEELATLDLPAGSRASVVTGGPVLGGIKDCVASDDETQWTRVSGVQINAFPDFSLLPEDYGDFDILFYEDTSPAILIEVVKDERGSLMGAAKLSGSEEVIYLSRNGVDVSQDAVNRLNEWFKTGDYRVAVSHGFHEESDFFDSFIKFYIYHPTISEVYVKGDSWERLAKESDGVEIREIYIGESLTKEQREWNLNTKQLVEQNKCTTVYVLTEPIDVLSAGTIIPQSLYKDGLFFYIANSVGHNQVIVNIGIDSNGNGLIAKEVGTPDSELSETSTNAIQNKAVYAALQNVTNDFQFSIDNLSESDRQISQEVITINESIANKQDKLVSGTNIKTINGTSLLGGGDITIVGEKGEKGDQGPVGPQGNSAFDGNGVEIVNNLTQGGEAAVLSAEQGKILKTELTELSEEIGELESYSKETKDIRASLTLNVNGFVKATGGIGDDAISLNANYRVWNPIEMKEGDIISINAYIPSSVAFISEYNRDTMQYTPLVVGTGETKEWTYTAISDMVVVMSTPYIPASTTVNYTTSVLLKTQVSRNKADIEQLKDKSISSALFNEIKQCVLNVAYSAVEGFNINTEEQFMSAKKMGFNSQKADIALTSDNSLVMCHDKGLTFDAYGRSVDYSSSNNMPILSMTREEFCSVEYATKTGVNYYSKHTDFESFLKCCKATGVIPYITLRDSTYYNADIVIPKMVEALNKYNLKDRCIISSYPHSIENLTKVRNALPNCLLAYVCNYEEVIDNTLINSLRTLGNSIIMLASSKQGSDLYSFISSQNEQITNAKDNGLIIGMCDIIDVDIYNNLVSMGLSAFQIYKPIFSGIRESFDFFLEVRQTSNNYTIKIADNTYIMLRSMLGARPIFSPIAELSEDGKVLTLSQFKKFKSDSSFPDGILEQWITRLPFVLGKSEGTSLQQVTLSRIDGKMTLNFSDSIKEYIEPSTFEIHFEI